MALPDHGFNLWILLHVLKLEREEGSWVQTALDRNHIAHLGIQVRMKQKKIREYEQAVIDQRVRELFDRSGGLGWQ